MFRRAESTSPVGKLSAALFDERARVVRFGLTGTTAAVIQLLLLRLFESWGAPALLANGAAFLLATQANFLMSQAFTWRDRLARTQRLGGHWTRYHSTVAGTALLNIIVFAVAATVLPSTASSFAPAGPFDFPVPPSHRLGTRHGALKTCRGRLDSWAPPAQLPWTSWPRHRRGQLVFVGATP
ncbi:MAG: GtrA family protein [Chloroflexi bacterium]|nr:GtrA family protein [Chloroflexota bacterium]